MTAVGSFTVGEVLTAASLNEIGAWTSFTPTINNVATSSKSGKYYKMNKIGFAYVTFVISAAPTGFVSIDWPSGFTPANTTVTDPRCNLVFYDTSATTTYPGLIRCTATNWRPTYPVVAGANVTYNDYSNTLYPVAPANTDIFSFFWVGEIS